MDHQDVIEGVFVPISKEEVEMEPLSIQELFEKIKQDKNIKVHDMRVPFQKDIQLYDFALQSRGQDEDKMYAVYPWYRQYIRRGNTILSKKEPEPSLMYGRKGFEKFFDLMIEYVQYNLEEIQDFGGLSLGDADTHNGLYDIIFDEVYKAMENGLKINVCKLVKANGENAQISWIKDVGAWLIASKNVSMLVRDENDLGLYKGDRFHFAKLIGKEWMRIAQRIEKEGLIEELKENMNGRTFVGEYCGNQKYQHLVKYTEIDIHFVAIVENDQMTTCLPPSEAFVIFKKFNLTRVGLTNVGTYDNWTTLNQTLKQIYIDVATAKIDSEEEGSVIYLTKVDETEGRQETLSLAKLKTLEYRIYRKLREKLRGFIGQVKADYKPWRDYFEKFCKETEELCRELKPPKELGYYFDVAKEAFEFGENYWEQSSIVNDEYITFLSVLMYRMSQNQKLLPEHFENTTDVLAIPWTDHYVKYQAREKVEKEEEKKMEIEQHVQKLKPKKKVYVIVPIGMPGMGKTYFLEKFRKTVEGSSGELSIISSDIVRKECMDRLARSNKRLTFEQLYEKTGKDARNLFNDRLRDLISKSDQRKKCKAHFIFIDKNHPPNAIKGTLDLIRGSSYHLDLEIVALTPKMKDRESVMRYDEEGKSHQYPFSTNFFFTCFDRVQQRKEHETLPGSGAKTAGVLIMFLHMFRNVNLTSESLASNGFHKHFEVPFTNETGDAVIPEDLMEALYNVLRATKPGEKCEDQGLVNTLNENYEKAEVKFANPEAGFVEECVEKFFQEQIQPNLAKIPEITEDQDEDYVDVNGKKERIEDPRTSGNEYNPSSLPLYLGLFAMEDPSFEVKEYILRGLELLSKTYPYERALVNNYNELKDGTASNLTYSTTFHITTLYIGNNFKKKETEYFKSFRENVVIDLDIVGFVIVPNKVVAAICYPDQSIIKIDNRFPHITLMKGQWPPKSSNDVMEALFGRSGPLSQKYNKKEFETDKEFTYKAPIKVFKGSGIAFVVKTGPNLRLKLESRPSNMAS